MSLNIETGIETLRKFLIAWPLSSLKTMTIEQYADLGNHNAFCYWLEYGSTDLGEIGGMPLTKFGLWQYKNRKDYADTYESDSRYAWSVKFGKMRMQAFNKIRSIIVEIADCSIRGDWETIESIDFHAVAKWKIAFMYSSNRLVPIYSRESLLKVAMGLSGYLPEDAPISSLQKVITEQRPNSIDMIQYSRDLWEHYVDGKPFRSYFIVGTNYKNLNELDTSDAFPEMLASNTIAIGFLRECNLNELIGASDEVINTFVETNIRDSEIATSKLQSYFRILMRLKPGDIVALRSHGLHGTQEIIAYAVVVEKNGKVYEYKPDLLGHHINVEFVELGIKRQTSFNYTGTIHQISSDRPEHLKSIFGPFLQVDNIALGTEFDNDFADNGEPKLKSEESYERGPIASRMIRQLHNIIQNALFKDLKKKFPDQFITLEFEGRVDIVRESEKERWFYEVKPFENVISCLRYASGQLIEYAFRFQDARKPTNLVIVGPGELKGEARDFFDHYVESINLPISYYQHISVS